MKTARFLTSATVLALLIGAGAAVAKPGDRGGPRMAPIDFSAADADGDGQITREELRARAAARFEAADTDGNGTLDAAELAARAEARRAERMAARMDAMIERRDTDGDGALSLSEIAPPNQQEMFDRIDTDDDGRISEAELERLERRMARRGMGGRHGDGHGRGDGSRWHRGDN